METVWKSRSGNSDSTKVLLVSEAQLNRFAPLATHLIQEMFLIYSLLDRSVYHTILSGAVVGSTDHNGSGCAEIRGGQERQLERRTHVPSPEVGHVDQVR